jgi:hypothetical protein
LPIVSFLFVHFQRSDEYQRDWEADVLSWCREPPTASGNSSSRTTYALPARSLHVLVQHKQLILPGHAGPSDGWRSWFTAVACRSSSSSCNTADLSAGCSNNQEAAQVRKFRCHCRKKLSDAMAVTGVTAAAAAAAAAYCCTDHGRLMRTASLFHGASLY